MKDVMVLQSAKKNASDEISLLDSALDFIKYLDQASENVFRECEGKPSNLQSLHPGGLALLQSLDRRLNHHDMYDEGKPFQCKTELFKEDAPLIAHRQTQYDGDKHKCSICQKAFLTKDLLKRHEFTHNRAELKCEFCGKSFLFKQHIDAHFKSCNKPSGVKRDLATKTESNSRLDTKLISCKSNGKVTVVTKHPNNRKNYHSKRPQAVKSFPPHSEQSLIRKRRKEKKERQTEYKCDYCGRTFQKRDYLVKHIKVHLKVRSSRGSVPESRKRLVSANSLNTHMYTHTCHFCEKRFVKRDDLLQHEKTHAGLNKEKLMANVPTKKSDLCGKSYASKRKLIGHIRTVEATNSFKCHLCYNSYASKERLVKHIKAHGTFHCHMCKKSYFYEATFKKHMQTHKSNLCYQYDLCNKKILSNYKMIKHVKAHERKPKIPKIFNCNSCKKIFALREDLTKHIRTHQKCDLCNNEMSLKYFKEHKQLSHDYPCNLCEYTFVCKREFNKHKKIIHGVLPTPAPKRRTFLKCDVCSKTYVLRPAFEAHRRKHENGTLECDLCGKRYTLKHNLAQHLLAHMNGKLTFQCDLCGRNLKRRDGLKMHMKTHEKKKRIRQTEYQCDHCGRTFHNRDCLVKHIKYVVMQVRSSRGSVPESRFECYVCGKRLVSAKSLNTHMYTHVAMREYACDFCEKRFFKRDNLLQHEKTHSAQREKPHMAQREKPHMAQREKPYMAQREKPHMAQREKPHMAQREKPHMAQREKTHMAQREKTHMAQRENKYMAQHENKYMAQHENKYMAQRENKYMAQHENKYMAQHENKYMAQQQYIQMQIAVETPLPANERNISFEDM